MGDAGKLVKPVFAVFPEEIGGREIEIARLSASIRFTNEQKGRKRIVA